MEERLKYLFQRYLDNSCTRREFDEFLWFVSNAGENDAIRELIKKVYEHAGKDASSQTYVDEAGNLVLTRPEWYTTEKPAPRALNKKWVVLAAAACITLIVGYAWLHQRTADTKTERVADLSRKSTERSEYKYVLLPDSTQVWLNAASSVDFPQQFDPQKRVVHLSGEAYFDVKHADKIPFEIHTGKVTTVVLGTAFNIKAYPDRKDVIVSVSRGKVKVNFDDEEVAMLTQGQQVKVSNTDIKQIEKKQVVNDAAPWQQGNLVYDDENMEDIIADLERVYDVRIRITDASIRPLRVSTSFKRDVGVEQVLQVLCQLTDTKLQQSNGQYTIQ